MGLKCRLQLIKFSSDFRDGSHLDRIGSPCFLVSEVIKLIDKYDKSFLK